MGVIMKGGPSGNRGDFLPSMPGPVPQPASRGGGATGKNPNVNFDGATSGNREDASPPVNVGFDPQAIQDTSGAESRAMPGIQVPLSSPNRASEGDPHPLIPTSGTPDDNAT